MKTKTTKPRKTKKNALLAALSPIPVVPAPVFTDNSALTNATTGTKVLDFFSAAGAIRNKPDTEALKLFNDAFRENKTLALKVLFYLSDVRQGQGERKLFRTVFRDLAVSHPNVARKLIQYIPEYTRFDNVIETLDGTPLEADAYTLMANQLRTDLDSENPTLAAKWAPSEQASSTVTKTYARKLRKRMNMSPKDYRRMLSSLRSKLNVVEREMCAQNWKEIDYEKVPSKASTLYRKAFGKHDPTGYGKFIKAVEKGEKKINASVLYPYDLVNIVRRGNDKTAEVQWKALPNYLKDNPHNGLVVADVSGSMDTIISGSVAAIDVSVSLAIYFAERNIGAFKNNFLIFGGETRLTSLKDSQTLREKVYEVMSNRPCPNTDLQKVFETILSKAKANKVPESEMPRTVYIVSDMEFDRGCENNKKTNLDEIKKKYKAAGYEMPSIVFWNVNGRSQNNAATKNDRGVSLISGCSPSILKSLFMNKEVTPYQVMLEVIDTERYAVIKA